MSQPLNNQYQNYPDPNVPVKPMTLPVINGQPNQHFQNGIQSQHTNFAGTPSSQSSRDPSRETSRDPSPTQYLHNPYRPQLNRPPLPPINGSQNVNPNFRPLLLGVAPQQRPTPVPQSPTFYNNANSNAVPYVSKPETLPNFQQPSPSIQMSRNANAPISGPPSVVSSSEPLAPPPGNVNSNVNSNATSYQSNQSVPQMSSGQFGPQPEPTQRPPMPPPVTNNPTNQNRAQPVTSPTYEPPSQGSIPQIPRNQSIQAQQQQPKYGASQNLFGGSQGSTSSQNLFINSQMSQYPMQSQDLSGPKSASSQQVHPLTPQNVPVQQPALYLVQQPAGIQMNVEPAVASRIPQGAVAYSQQQPTSQTKYSQNTQLPVSTTNSMPLQAGIPAPSTMRMPPLPGQQTQNQYDSRPLYPDQMSNVPLDNMPKRYPAYPDQMGQMNNQMSGLTLQSGFNKLWGMETIDLLQCRSLLPPEKVEAPKINLHQEFLDRVNCSPDIFRCTLTKIPESNSLLQKSRLPLGVLIHPFKDLSHLPVIQCSTIVRCRVCRTYINPFVYFVDAKRWKCNMCYRVNELPQEFQFDPVTKTYGDPSRRPEVKTCTIEFIAPTEYMLRPPPPAVYLFVLDVSRLAVESGYLSVVCNTIAKELVRLPGDTRTQVGFLAVDSAVHFFSMPENVSQPHEIVMLDVDDVFIPCPDNLIVNLKEREELLRDLLAQLPEKFKGTHDTNSALGAALQAAVKLMSSTGGRVTVFQTCLPNLGPGALQSREDPNSRASKDVPHLNPATDFYKRLALDCSGQQIAMDLFLLNCQYSDLATLSGMSKFSGGCIYHMPLFRTSKPQHADVLDRMLRRYLNRKIGFEAVMRIRCTRGLSIHTFHGNFFVRSTDLLSLPNINPDAGFGMQVSIEENLSDTQNVCFQAALLYTSSKGERRIRVHTLCLPVATSLPEILHSADQQCIVGLLAKMAADKSQQSSLSDARDALINAAIDVLSAFKLTQSSSSIGLLAPSNLKLLPLYIIAVMKHVAFRAGMNTRLDDRVFAMCQLKALPLQQLIQAIYPDLYPIHLLDDKNAKEIDGKLCPQAPRLHLSAEKLDSQGIFLLDAVDKMYIYVGKNIHPTFCTSVFGVPSFSSIPEEMYELPELPTPESERVRNFVFSLQEEKPYYATLQIIRDDSHFKTLFTERLIEDRLESALSYYEFLQHIKTQIK